MTASIAALPHRALIRLTGPDWASFLKGLCTAHIDDIAAEMARGEYNRLHYGAFLRPQGKLICDVLLHAVAADDIRLDVPAVTRDELFTKLSMYKLRARVTLEKRDDPVSVAWDAAPAADGFMPDPRGVLIGAPFAFRYHAATANSEVSAWRQFRFRHGLSEPGSDFGPDQLYAIDANLDLLGAVDFHKGCYVGQELTSRMKRRGQIRNRVFGFHSPDGPPAIDAEILNGDKRAGDGLAAEGTYGLGLMRLDRMEGDLQTEAGRLEIIVPEWMKPFLPMPEA